MFALFVYRSLFSRTKFVISKKVSCVAEYCMVQFSFVCALKKVSCVAECSFDLSPVLQSFCVDQFLQANSRKRPREVENFDEIEEPLSSATIHGVATRPVKKGIFSMGT